MEDFPKHCTQSSTLKRRLKIILKTLFVKLFLFCLFAEFAAERQEHCTPDLQKNQKFLTHALLHDQWAKKHWPQPSLPADHFETSVAFSWGVKGWQMSMMWTLATFKSTMESHKNGKEKKLKNSQKSRWTEVIAQPPLSSSPPSTQTVRHLDKTTWTKSAHLQQPKWGKKQRR